eukprot:scaffold112743_cov25-Tisochrysis_lutea.AAC.1
MQEEICKHACFLVQFKALDREHKDALVMCGHAKAALHDFEKYEMDMEFKLLSAPDPEAAGQRIRPMLEKKGNEVRKEVRGMGSYIQMACACMRVQGSSLYAHNYCVYDVGQP